MIYLFSFFLCLLLSLLFWKIGERYQIYDKATLDPLKIHKKSVSCLGGLAMILSLIIVFCLKMIIDKSFDCQIFSVLIAASLIFLLGFIDDLKWRDKTKTKPFYKFIFLILFSILTGLILSTAGIKFQFFPILIIEAIFTFCYIFVLVNTINYQDGLDGLAGGTTFISLIGLFLLSTALNNDLGSVLSLFSITIISGFLVFNLPPAKIFMGDSGAYFLGFILAVITMTLLEPYDFFKGLALVFILGLPLLDGVFTNLRRLFSKQSIFLGDRMHFYDRMIKKGFSMRKTILVSYILQSVSVLIGLLIRFYI